MFDRNDIADRHAIEAKLKAALHNKTNSLVHGDIEISIEDIVHAFTRFRRQTRFYADNGYRWPSVVLDRVDFDGLYPIPRTVPLDIPALEKEPVSFSEWERAVDYARNKGLPLIDRPVEEARHGFIRGAIDGIFGKGLWRIFGSGDPNVTVESRPQGILIMVSDGHFFSTSRAFGQTNHTESIKAGAYCFYKETTPPTTSLRIYTISGDRKISFK
jgi:hypothetical protein